MTEFFSLLLYFNNDNGEIYLNNKDEEILEFLKYFHTKDFYSLIKKERKKTVDRLNQSKQRDKEKTNNSFFTKLKSFFSFNFSRSDLSKIDISSSNKRKNDSFEVI